MNKFKVITISSLLILAGCFKEKTLTEKLADKNSLSSKVMPSEVKKIMGDAMKHLKSSGIEQTAIQEGTVIPEFDIGSISFSEIYSQRPVILKFYRGSWCPYCQIELKDYQRYAEEFEKKGYEVVILTPDNTREIERFKKKNNISFSIYQDKDNMIAKKMGIAFKVGDKLLPIYKKFGIDLELAQENSNNELPMPGTYVINKEGKITYAFIDADYTKRLDPVVLLQAI